MVLREIGRRDLVLREISLGKRSVAASTSIVELGKDGVQFGPYRDLRLLVAPLVSLLLELLNLLVIPDSVPGSSLPLEFLHLVYSLVDGLH